jgi:hypothetical protein
VRRRVDFFWKQEETREEASESTSERGRRHSFESAAGRCIPLPERVLTPSHPSVVSPGMAKLGCAA